MPPIEQIKKNTKQGIMPNSSSAIGNKNPIKVDHTQTDKEQIASPVSGRISAKYNHGIGPGDTPNPKINKQTASSAKY